MESIRDFRNGWIRIRNIVAYPHGWQTPAKTEQWAYETYCNHLPSNPFNQLFCFPWATLIDLLRVDQRDKAKPYLLALNYPPPKLAPRRTTVCQHIYAMDMLPFFKELGITDVYWPHTRNGLTVKDGIKFHPFPLYPVMFYQFGRKVSNIPITKRKYLYSFVGSYEAGLYLSEVRNWIFSLPKREDAFVESRGEWHFQGEVYRNQINGIPDKEELKFEQTSREKEYIAVMQNSVFCLCPSGSGPNSIRLWEALEFNSYPIILSDDLLLHEDFSEIEHRFKFSETIDSVNRLPEILEKERERLINEENETMTSLNVDLEKHIIKIIYENDSASYCFKSIT